MHRRRSSIAAQWSPDSRAPWAQMFVLRRYIAGINRAEAHLNPTAQDVFGLSAAGAGDRSVAGTRVVSPI